MCTGMLIVTSSQKRKLSKMVNKTFSACVRLLEKAAKRLGMTYEEINVWVFCIIWPLATIGLIIALILK